jgi:SAM-dependent methyltransferase
MPIKNNYADTIIASEVIEHLRNPFLFLSECKRIIKKDGRIILTTPNALSLSEFQQYWLPNNHALPYGEHLVNWHKINMDNLLREVGLEVEHFEYISFHWKRNYLFRLLAWMIPILRPTLYYVLRKKDVYKR